jgi:hypothetical protein
MPLIGGKQFSDLWTYDIYQALGALGLKTGGTVQQRAERLFLTKVGCPYVVDKLRNLNLKL